MTRSETALSRRAGTHREPGRRDWRRRVGSGRGAGLAALVGLGSDIRNRRRMAAVSVSVAAALVVGGTHLALSAAGSSAPSDLDASGLNPGPQWNHPSPSDDGPAGPSSPPAAAPGPAATPARPTSSPNPLRSLPRQVSQANRARQGGGSGPVVTPTRTGHPGRTPATTAPVRTTSAGSTTPPVERPAPTGESSPTGSASQPAPVTGTGTVIGIGGQCLDVADGQDDDGAAVQIFGCNGSDAQLWTVQDGTVRALGRCLSATGDGAGRQLEMSDCDGRSAQHWQLVAAAIVNPGSALCLDVEGDTSLDGTPVSTATCAGSGEDQGQHWQLG